LPKTVSLDERHLMFRIPTNLPEAEVRAVRRAQDGKAFTAAVCRVEQTAVRQRVVLKPVR
jgi:hypothetical protein